MKNWKKMTLSLFVAGALLAGPALTYVPTADGTGSTLSVAEARGGHGGGFRMSAPKAAPKAAPAPKAPAANNGTPSKSVSGSGNTYQPSTSAKNLQKDAPASNANTAAGRTTTSAAQTGSSGLGSMMRSVGLLAGGMFLGSMIASALGMGGFMADALGFLANLAILAAVIYGIRYLWRRIRTAGARSEAPRGPIDIRRESAERSTVDASAGPKIRDITPPKKDTRDITSSDSGYDAKSAADRYRRL